jgi:hypothetical protein
LPGWVCSIPTALNRLGREPASVNQGGSRTREPTNPC